ncbi:MAG: TIGR04283 family arsenosugar biosynthesis glycosyltransferase [Arenicella sp.]|nr:TIGR04283 family arsenosugar biosynthesis glycosyltransferase [Arenicella sp.]
MLPTLAIIVPALNEMPMLPALSQQLVALGVQQSIIVDGGSDDGSWEWLRANWHNGKSRLALQSDGGRAGQMNAGAAHSEADIYLFLHADSVLPDGAVEAISGALADTAQWGRLDVRFDSTMPAMKVIEWFINVRARLTGVATGDQAIFVARELFERVGGYDLIPLMEDIALSTKLKRLGRPACLADKVLTSARRWEQGGVIKTVLLMWYLRLAYYCGVPAERLARQYAHIR